jgi:Tfp pilus assembly protein PilX
MTSRAPGREGGATLLLVMMLLLVTAWLALSAYRISSQEARIVGNYQAQRQATAAAQRAIEQTISSNLFTKDPQAVAATPIDTDMDGDAKVDLQARLDPPPACVGVRPIKTVELDVSQAADRVCLQSSGRGSNLVLATGTASTAGDSLCAASDWNVSAAVSDPVTNTSVRVNQGVAIRLEAADAKSYCK